MAISSQTPRGAKPAQRKPQCQEMKRNDEGHRSRCINDGNVFNIQGEYGTFKKLLCHDCERVVRLTGWKVDRVAPDNSDTPLLRKQQS